MKVEPQSPRIFSSCTLILDDGHAGIVKAALQQCRNAQGVFACVLRGDQLRAMRVGSGGFLPGTDHRLENGLLNVTKRQRLAEIALGQFLVDKCSADARVLQQAKIGFGVGGERQQAIKETVEINAGLRGVGQGKAGNNLAAGLQIGNGKADRWGEGHRRLSLAKSQKRPKKILLRVC